MIFLSPHLLMEDNNPILITEPGLKRTWKRITLAFKNPQNRRVPGHYNPTVNAKTYSFLIRRFSAMAGGRRRMSRASA